MGEPHDTPAPDEFVPQGAQSSRSTEHSDHRSRKGRLFIVMGCVVGLASVPLEAQLPRMAQWLPDLTYTVGWLAIVLPILALTLAIVGLVRARHRKLPTAEILLVIASSALGFEGLVGLLAYIFLAWVGS
jgi:O-antigen/teichoic acid export membrane protein